VHHDRHKHKHKRGKGHYKEQWHHKHR
jgi:hypothetical protein